MSANEIQLHGRRCGGEVEEAIVILAEKKKVEVLGHSAWMGEKSILDGQIHCPGEEDRHTASCPQGIVGTRVLSRSSLPLFCVGASFGVGDGAHAAQFHADHARAHASYGPVVVDVALGAFDGPDGSSGLGCGGEEPVGESQRAVHVKGGVQMGGRTSDETVRGDASLWAGIL